MAQRSQVFRVPSYWTCPPGVSCITVNAIAPGGGGDSQTGFQASKAGGGAGEFCMNLQVLVVPGNVYFIDPGSGGAGSVPSISSAGNGASITLPNGMLLLGGKGVVSGAGSTQGGNGGGAGGGIRNIPIVGTGGYGNQESPTHWGGCGGADGSGGGGHGAPGGQAIGQYPAIGGDNPIGTPGGGSAGGATPWSEGGMGGDGYDGSGPDPDDGPCGPGKGSVIGAGGGGAAQDSGSTAETAVGGPGASGMVQIFYCQNI